MGKSIIAVLADSGMKVGTMISCRVKNVNFGVKVSGDYAHVNIVK